MMTLRYVALWGAARPSGSLLATARQVDVLRAFTEQIAGLIGGDRWIRAEAAATANARGREELRHQIASGDERALSALVAAQQARIGQLPIEQRVAFLADGAQRFLYLPELRTPAAPVGGGVLLQRRRDNPEHPHWLSELALRLASDPTTVPTWAGMHLERGIKNLLIAPALFRAARFMVLALAEGPSSSGMRHLYPGWSWNEPAQS